MALRAGYYGVKRDDAEKLKKMPGISEIGTGLELDDDGELTATGATKTIEGNPEGSATETLTKLQIGDDIYSIPGNDNTKCYQTDDSTESAIVDGDYIPFLDSSAASGAGAPRKSTWSNFCNKIQSKLTAFVDWDTYGVLGVKNLLDISNILNLYIDTTNMKYVSQGTPNICVAKVQPNTKYIITKQAGTNFRVATSQNYPADNVVITSTYADHTGTEIQITTGANDNYLGVYTTEGDFPTCMVRLATDPDSTYAPYAMTNQELTPVNVIATTDFTFDTNGSGLIKQGSIVVPYLRVTGVTATADDNTTPICVVPESCRPKFAKVVPIISSGAFGSATIYTDGKVVTKANLSNATVTMMVPWSV